MLQKSFPLHFSEIKIGAWNVNSIWKNINSFKYNKLQNPNFLKVICKKKIFGLIETHHTADQADSLHIDGYKCFSLCRPKDKNKKRYKPSGGIATYVHESIKTGVEKLPISGSECIILKLKKDFFGLVNDIFLCFAYCTPSNSSVLNSDFMPTDIWEDLTNKLAQCQQKGDLILMGDLNARTKMLPDFIANENNDHIPVPPSDLYEADTAETECIERWNIDTGFNSYGTKLLNLCKNLPLRILNGRFLGDLLGNFTCFTPRGASAVDYAAVSPALLPQVRYFLVETPCLNLTDHTPIELGLAVNAVTMCSNEQTKIEMVPKPDKIVWDKNLAAKY